MKTVKLGPLEISYYNSMCLIVLLGYSDTIWAYIWDELYIPLGQVDKFSILLYEYYVGKGV